MYLARVIGTVVSTSKDTTLCGSKLLIVARLDEKLEREGPTQIATDTVGAGCGEIVIVTTGSAARQSSTLDHCVTDASIVGIVDSVEAQ